MRLREGRVESVQPTPKFGLISREYTVFTVIPACGYVANQYHGVDV